MRNPLLLLSLSLLLGASAPLLAAPVGKIKICLGDSPQLPASERLEKDKMFSAMDGESRRSGKITAVFLAAPVVVGRGKCVVADAVHRPFQGMKGDMPVKDQVFMEVNGAARATAVDTFH